MLEGKSVNLRIMEREDLPLLKEWVNDLDFEGVYEPISQETKTDLERRYDQLKEGQWFFIEKKDGTKIGYIAHFLANEKRTALGYALAPSERGKGYGSEAIKIVIDYLFMSKNIVRVQAEINPENVASQRALENAGFKKEGILRKAFFSRGEWIDTAIFSILREEWKEPEILTRKT
jgi:ribosomal-protein-alanine N-acetyltransferase